MKKYNLNMRIMHWLISIMIIGAIGVGLYMADLPDSEQKWSLYALHKSFGILILGLLFLRVIVRLSSEIPALPENISSMEQKLSKLTVLVLYAFMFAMPISGYIASDAGGYGVSFFGITLPDFFSTNPELSKSAIGVHEIVGYLLIGLVALHILGAIKHIVIDKVNILSRMW